MYVCICKAVSEKRVRAAVADGAMTLRDLREQTALGTNCGKCVPHAYELLRETLAQKSSAAESHELMVRSRSA